MTSLRPNNEIGLILKQARNEHRMQLEVAIEELLEYDVKCSFSNLAKIERGEISIRADILAALCVIYKLNLLEVIYKKAPSN